MRLKKFLLFFGIAVVIVVFLAYQGIKVRQKGKRNFDRFYSSNLDGKITSIGVNLGAVYLEIDSAPGTYVFFPRTSEINDNEVFTHVAAKGDRVIKQAFSDTLRLVKDNKAYLYTFQKLNKP